ncbi:MAG: hypothetical protein FWG68_06080 [Defluviitaleaceae bacterium]|nr:hypothetical protein [Defluviitaleaceae bacterium]
MYRIWYSTESFADLIVDNTVLKNRNFAKSKLYESDANNPKRFHAMPDHIRKILYLDAPDLIVEQNNEPIFSMEISTEAGTGHNAFQRFARIAASVENGVPAFYIYPEGVIIRRQNAAPRWDMINPVIFKALESVMSIYDIPALLFYFPTYLQDGQGDVREFPNPLDKKAKNSVNLHSKGLRYEKNLKYLGCPSAETAEMRKMFDILNEVVTTMEQKGLHNGRKSLLRNLLLRERRNFMQEEFTRKANGQNLSGMSPISATVKLPTEYLLNYLSTHESPNYSIGELLRRRKHTIFYKVNAKFRGDPYPGALSALDYLLCREGKTFEERRNNLVLVFGNLQTQAEGENLAISDTNGSTIAIFFSAVQNSEKHNLLSKNYEDLESAEIPRYFMQARYGSTYSKVKHIRIYSYFADAILFPDGSLWRDG